MTEPNKLQLSDPRVPTIKLAGLDWPVPMLAIEQNEIVTPVVLKWMPAIAEGKGKLSWANREAMRDLADAAYWSLRRAHPDLTREEFNGWTINVLELVGALVVIGRQTGLLREGGGGGGGEVRPLALVPPMPAATENPTAAGTH